MCHLFCISWLKRTYRFKRRPRDLLSPRLRNERYKKKNEKRRERERATCCGPVKTRMLSLFFFFFCHKLYRYDTMALPSLKKKKFKNPLVIIHTCAYMEDNTSHLKRKRLTRYIVKSAPPNTWDYTHSWRKNKKKKKVFFPWTIQV